MLDSIIEREDGYYYYSKGTARKDSTTSGLVKIGEDYYFVDYNGKCSTGKIYAWATNCDLPVGHYEFASDGKMLNGIVEKATGTYYYTLGKVGQTVGLTQVGEDYYFIDYSGKCATGSVYAWKTNCDLPCADYKFAADGKLLNGIVENEDGVYYYTYGKVGRVVGLTRVEDDYYFVDYSGKCSTGKIYVWATNCDLPIGYYEFGTDGRMLNGIVEKAGTIYCYVLGGIGKTAGLTKIGDDYYFVDYDGTCATGRVYVWATNCDLPIGYYEFDENGKAVDGFITKGDQLYYYVNGQPAPVGINFVDGYYYFVDYGGKLIVNCTYYVWQGNGLLAHDNYRFNEKGQITSLR
jgi:glucan-binding YG repeat protein